MAVERETSESFSGLTLLRATIESKNGNVINLIDPENGTSIFQSMTINEDMFSAGVHGTLLFKDSGNMGQNLPLVGGEILEVDLRSDSIDVDQNIKTFRFYISKVIPSNDQSGAGIQNSTKPTFWSIEFTGYENLYFNYTEPVIFEDGDDIVKKIATGGETGEKQGLVNSLADRFFNPGAGGQSGEAVNSNQEAMFIEPTGNSVWLKKNTNFYPFRKPVQQVPVIKLMNYLAENSISDTNPNAVNFLFWQDLDRWNFRSIEGILDPNNQITLLSDVEALGGERAGRVYEVDALTGRQDSNTFVSFQVSEEFSPLKFMDSGAYISEYLRVDPDYENPYLDFTSFYGSHKNRKVQYSYKDEFEKVRHIENYSLVDDTFEFEPDIPVRRYDNLHGYFDESYYNDPVTRLRHTQNSLTEVYRSDKNHLGNTAAYNEDVMWQSMFDQTELSGELLKEIVKIRKTLKEKRDELARKRDLKEKWSAYRCSVCCLVGYNDGSTGPCLEESGYQIVSAGSFSDVVNYDPDEESANENGLYPAYDFENDPDLQATLEEFLKLRRPDNIEAVLFQIDAQIYAVEQAINKTSEAIDLCSSNPSPPFFDHWTGPETQADRTTYSAPLGYYPGASTWFSPSLGASYYYYYYGNGYGGYSSGVQNYRGPLGYGGYTQWPCEGCYYFKNECNGPAPPGDYGPECSYNISVIVDTTRPTCILSRGSYILNYYGNLRDLLVQYKETFLSAYDSWIKRKVFKKAKEEYLEIPGTLPLTFQNVKTIKRKKIRGSRYEVFAVNRSLVDDIEDAYEYLVDYGEFGGRVEDDEAMVYLGLGLHPYYDQSVNTSIGEFGTGEIQYTPIDGVNDGFISDNSVVLTEGHHERNITTQRAYPGPTQIGDAGNTPVNSTRYVVDGQSLFYYSNNYSGNGFYYGYNGFRYYGGYYGGPWWGYGWYWWQSLGTFVVNQTTIAPSTKEIVGEGTGYERIVHYPDGQIQHNLVGYNALGSYYNRTRYGGYLYQFDPGIFDYCEVYDCGDPNDLVELYSNSMNWYVPAETDLNEVFIDYQSPVRFMQENQHYIRIEFNEPIGLETLEEFPYGYIRDAGIEYYLPYLVQVTPGPFGRHSSSFNISVIGVDPYGFDIAATRTDTNTRNYRGERSPFGTVRSSFFPSEYLKNHAYNDYLTTWYRVPTANNVGMNHRTFGRLPNSWQAPEDDWFNITKFNTPPIAAVMYDDFEKSLLRSGNTEEYFASRDPSYVYWWDYNYSGIRVPPGADSPELTPDQSEDSIGDYITSSLTLSPDQYLGPTWETYEWKLWNTELRCDSDDEIWRYDVSGESEYGVMSPTFLFDDGLERTDYYHELVRNFSGTFVVYAKQDNICNNYECANPDGPVIAPRRPTDPDELEEYDPYINCPAQYLRPDKLKGATAQGPDGITADFTEPTCQELKNLEVEINECDLIRENLGEEYLGCLFSNPTAPNSCNCPEQGSEYLNYLEHSRTYATFWDTPNETPLRREAQMIQFGYQKASGVLPGDFSLKPGQVITVDIDPGVGSFYSDKRQAGRWMVTGASHAITSQNHLMQVTCRRDSVPTDLNDTERPDPILPPGQ